MIYTVDIKSILKKVLILLQVKMSYITEGRQLLLTNYLLVTYFNTFWKYFILFTMFIKKESETKEKKENERHK